MFSFPHYEVVFNFSHVSLISSNIVHKNERPTMNLYYTHTHAHAHTHTHACIHTCTHTCAHRHTHTYTHTHTHVHTHMHTHAYTHTHARARTHTHTHTHSLSLSLSLSPSLSLCHTHTLPINSSIFPLSKQSLGNIDTAHQAIKTRVVSQQRSNEPDNIDRQNQKNDMNSVGCGKCLNIL